MKKHRAIKHSSRKERSQAKHKKILIISLISSLVFLFGGVIFLIIALQSSFNTDDFIYSRTIDYKSEYRPEYGTVHYCNLFNCQDAAISSSGSVDTGATGEYKISIVAKHEDRQITLEQIVTVKDLSAPIINTESDTVTICPNQKIAHFEYTATDALDGDLTDKATIRLHDDSKVYIEVVDSTGNTARKALNTTDKDTEAPVITINGADKLQTRSGVPYYDSGAVATDNCDGEIKVETTNKVNSNIAGKYEVIYTATDAAGNTTSAIRNVDVTRAPTNQPGNKVIYLTFDDGPSEHTSRLLDTLKKYNVKATFFVTGNGPDDAILREWREGHAIGLHTLSHNYSKIYRNQTAFYDDLYAIQNRVKNITGYTSMLMRFPGGSSNTVSRNYDGGAHIMSQLVRSVTERGFTYFDWNVSSGDAGNANTTDAVYNNVVNALKSGRSIVLQHDVNGASVDAVERIIKYGMEHGYTFNRLEPGYFGAHHGVNN